MICGDKWLLKAGGDAESWATRQRLQSYTCKEMNVATTNELGREPQTSDEDVQLDFRLCDLSRGPS